MNHFKRLFSAHGLTLAMLSTSAIALDTLPGDAAAPPVGTTLVGGYYVYNDLHELRSGGHTVDGPKARADISLLRVVHPIQIGEYQVNPQFVLPYGRIEGRGTLSNVDSASGVGDLSVLASIMLKQDPATRTSIYLMPGVTLPTGVYDKDRISIGAKRYSFVIQGGAQTSISENWTIDAYVDATWYGTNNDNAGGNLKKKALYSAQSYLRYSLSKKTEVSAGVRYTKGGENSVSGSDQNDSLKKTTFLMGGSAWIAPTVLLHLQVGADTSVNNGFKASKILEARLVKVF